MLILGVPFRDSALSYITQRLSQVPSLIPENETLDLGVVSSSVTR